MQKFQNILVVRTDRIGDVVLTTPAVVALREANLDARISILVTPQTFDIVDGNPYFDEILLDDRKGAHRGLWGFWRLVCLLRKRKFDAAIVFHTKRRANLLCFLAGIPNRVGYKNNKFGFLLTQGIPDTRPEGTKHEAEYCLDVLKHIGIKVNTFRLYLPLKEESEAWVEKLFFDNDIFPADRLIAVHPGASCISKRWPAENFSGLINQIIEKRLARIILIGGAESKKIAADVLRQVKIPLTDVTGKASLSQLASLLKKCRLLISNDSGPVHMAAAVGTPVISIFGRNQAGLSPARWRPLGGQDIVLHKEVGCEVCLAHNCLIDFECLKAVSIQNVLDAAQSLLSR